MKVAIIGCGLIGKKRALALDPDDSLIACCDTNEKLAKGFSEQFGCSYFISYKELLTEVNCDVIIIAVVNKFILEIISDVLNKGLHVVVEKPLGRNSKEAEIIIHTLESARKLHNKFIILKMGFNHRFHPAIWEARQIVQENKIGKVLNIRGRYGHGGRPGMENEWRSSKDLCGGGELLDQGVHLIDLIGWFGGEIKEVFGKAETKFWDIEVEDNAFAILKSSVNVTASFHVSWTNWKNIFSLEVFGSDGYVRIEGLGGSYGRETLEIGMRKVEGGTPVIENKEYPLEDYSWKREWEELKIAVQEAREAIGNGYDGYNASKVIDAIYESSLAGKIIVIE